MIATSRPSIELLLPTRMPRLLLPTCLLLPQLSCRLRAASLPSSRALSSRALIRARGCGERAEPRVRLRDDTDGDAPAERDEVRHGVKTEEAVLPVTRLQSVRTA